MSDQPQPSTDPTTVIEDDDVARFVREWAAVDTDGEVQANRFLVRAGKSLNSCTKVAEPIAISPGMDLAKLIRVVRKRIGVGVTMGVPHVWLEAYEENGKHACARLPIDGDPTAVRATEEAEDDAPSSNAMGAMANALAGVAKALMGQNKELTQTLMAVAGNQIELVGEAAALTTEIQVRSEFGFQEGWQKIVESSMPQLLQAAPALLSIYLAHSSGEKGPSEAQTPDGRFRQRCSDIERSALLMVAWANEPATIERLKRDPNLRMEVRGRLGQLVNAAMEAFGRIVNEADAPPTGDGGAGAST